MQQLFKAIKLIKYMIYLTLTIEPKPVSHKTKLLDDGFEITWY